MMFVFRKTVESGEQEQELMGTITVKKINFLCIFPVFVKWGCPLLAVRWSIHFP